MKHAIGAVSILLAASLIVSCAGAPKPAKGNTPPPEQTASDDQMRQAKDKRDYIKQNGLDAYAPEPYAQAEEHFAAAEAAYGSDKTAAHARLASAMPLYEKTIQDGFAKKIAEKKKAADTARARADAEKAKVAAKDEYAAADASYNDAKKAFTESRYPETVTGYEKATTGFDASAKTAAERREAASAAMKEADETIKSTDDRINAIDTEMKTTDGGAQ